MANGRSAAWQAVSHIRPSDYPQVPGVTFVPVRGFPGYIVGGDGTVWSCWQSRGTTWRKLKPGIRHPKYREGDRPSVRMAKHGRSYVKRIATVVLESFIGPRPDGMEACHFPDNNTSNNRLDNLRWDTPLGNHNDKRLHGTTPAGERNPKAKLSWGDVFSIRYSVRNGTRTRDIASDFGISMSTVQRIIKGTLWKPYDAAVLSQKIREGETAATATRTLKGKVR